MSELFRITSLSKRFPVQKNLVDLLLAGQQRSFVHAVDDISFHINRGEVLGLAGDQISLLM